MIYIFGQEMLLTISSLKIVFRRNNIVKNNVKEKNVYSGYRKTFDSTGSWSFDNDSARNFIIFGADNNS